jgi:uncharacterized protein
MAPNPRRQDARLQALYDEIPAINCQGLCHDSCGPIVTSVRERNRIEKAAGKPLTCGRGASCSMLTADRRCGVYEQRPMICRLWGVIRGLACPYGCRPERYLDELESFRLLVAAEEAGGSLGGRERAVLETLAAQLPEEELLRRMRATRVAITPIPTLEGRYEGALPKSVVEQ